MHETLAPLLPLPSQAVFALIGGAVCPLVLLRKTSHPAFEAAMAFGNVAVALALGTIVFYGLVQAPERPPLDELRLADPSGLGLMFGVSLLMFSCHLEAVTIEQDMARRGAFDRMLVWTFVVLAALFLGFGACVYRSFGEATGRVRAAGGGWAEATVMQNLPEGGFLTAVKLLMSLNLLLMTPITMLPASRAIEAPLRLSARPLARSALRVAVLAGITAAAAVVPDFETVVGLTGSLGGLTAFTLPALLFGHFCGADHPTCRALASGVAAFGALGTAWSFWQICFPAAETS